MPWQFIVIIGWFLFNLVSGAYFLHRGEPVKPSFGAFLVATVAYTLMTLALLSVDVA